MKRTPRKRVGALHVLQASSFTASLKQLQQRVFALTADSEVYVPCIQRGVGINGWEITTPDDRHLWTQPADFAAGFHSCHHLGSRHDGHTQQLHLILVN